MSVRRNWLAEKIIQPIPLLAAIKLRRDDGGEGGGQGDAQAGEDGRQRGRQARRGG